MVGCYLAPSTDLNLKSVIAEVGHSPRSAELLIAVDFNTDLESLDRNKCNKAIVASMSMVRLEDMMEHFLSPKLLWMRDGYTWSMLCCFQEVRSWTDFILGAYCCLFHNMAVWDPRNDTNHYQYGR